MGDHGPLPRPLTSGGLPRGWRKSQPPGQAVLHKHTKLCQKKYIFATRVSWRLIDGVI